ncbi:putative glycoprotein 3-alpha-L-fucosyltransferase [Helianthus annuus]|nr:putative glycoprotein 3-alpha-L-fucosyltransferase [Helianthus annuus]
MYDVVTRLYLFGCFLLSVTSLCKKSCDYYYRRTGDPLRVYMDLEAGRKKSGFEDIFISYHAKDDVQSTYAGGLFHNNRNYHLSPSKNNVSCPTIFFYFV